MTDLVVAFFDIETGNDPFGEKQGPMWPLLPFEEIRFAVGVVRYVHFRKETTPKGTKYGHALLLENVHFSPGALLADLLRPICHVVCGYNAVQFDVPILAAKAGTLDGPAYTQAPALDRRLRAKLFDPLDWLAKESGHPHLAKLDAFREGLELRPFTHNGLPVGGAEVPILWQRGALWTVVEKCKADVAVLDQLVHAGLYGRLPVDHLNQTWTDATGELHEARVAQWRSPHTDKGGKWRYLVDTRPWWEELAATAIVARNHPSPTASPSSP